MPTRMLGDARPLMAQKDRVAPLSRAMRALGDESIAQMGWSIPTKRMAKASTEVGCSAVAVWVDGTSSLRMTVINAAIDSTVTELTGERACRACISPLAVSSSSNKAAQLSTSAASGISDSF